MKIIDLTFDLAEGIPCFNAHWHVPLTIEQLGHVDEVGRNTSKITIGSHCGTHIDSPRHFFNNTPTVEQLSLDLLCGEISVFDMRGMEENGEVTIDILNKFNLTKRVLFAFGWCEKWNTDSYYKKYPFFTKEATQYLIDNGVKLICLDTPSPDDSRAKLLTEEDSIIHKLFLGNDVVLVEYLNNTDKINYNKKHKIYALPIKLCCDGAPARVILEEVD